MRVLAQAIAAHRALGRTADSVPLIKRALTAYRRSMTFGQDFPDADAGQVVELDDKRMYVLLWRDEDLLRVYRVRLYDGILKVMKRHPPGVRACEAPQRRVNFNLLDVA